MRDKAQWFKEFRELRGIMQGNATDAEFDRALTVRLCCAAEEIGTQLKRIADTLDSRNLG